MTAPNNTLVIVEAKALVYAGDDAIEMSDGFVQLLTHGPSLGGYANIRALTDADKAEIDLPLEGA